MAGFKKATAVGSKPMPKPFSPAPTENASSTASSPSQSDNNSPKPAFSFSLGGSSGKGIQAKANGGKFSMQLGNLSKGRSSTLHGRGHKRQRSPSPTELITGFDTASGNAIAVHKKEERGPLVIVPPKNKNWIEEAKKKRAVYMPVGSVIDAERDRQADEQEQISKRRQNYGLTIREKVQKSDGSSVSAQESISSTDIKVEAPIQDGSQSRAHIKKETDEEKAIRKIASEFMDDDDNRKSDLVIKLASSSTTMSADQIRQVISEEEAYRQDIASRPDAPDMDAYEAVPVEDFGFALLRGMGWKGDVNK
ncbi:uncharacterized protein V2V93DRAFT_364395 [Kockiozyma suomiensis]|uniref:uncharacterized protein n=1 Tax=Kockiozyma suomiensis TaxID=1337062 RepID=UPI0033437631